MSHYWPFCISVCDKWDIYNILSLLLSQGGLWSGLLICLIFYYRRTVVGCQLLGVDFDCRLCLVVRVIVCSWFRVSVVKRWLQMVRCRCRYVVVGSWLLGVGCRASVIDCHEIFAQLFHFRCPALPSLLVQYDLLYLKVLSNGARGGPKLVSIDPFW